MDPRGYVKMKIYIWRYSAIDKTLKILIERDDFIQDEVFVGAKEKLFNNIA